ncbi:MAG: hypothetical protein Q8R25_04545 [bacterium]|nr:hypothetical protein [bacterium]
MSNRLLKHGDGVKFPRYAQAEGLWVITTYFNPCGYKTRRDNYELFAFSMRNAGIPLLVVECAFGDQPFELPESLDVVQVRCNSLLWQKERLLNLAASWLPKECTAVAWHDCDILHMNANWAPDTVRLLRNHAVVQLFEKAILLDKGNVQTEKTPQVRSFGAIAPSHPELLSCGRYDRHGHTGYGWAMRREIFDKVGLYEYAVGGSADHYMAHAIYNVYGFCVEHSLQNNPRAVRHLKEWGERFYELVQGKFTAVPGEIVHLWHGELVNRRYLQRMLETNALGYDPYIDVIAPPGQPLEWHPEMDKQGLRDYFTEYFRSRREDG